MRRREFIAGLGVAAWPLAARAQQTDRMQRIGVLMPYDEHDPDAKVSLSAFVQGLAALGWADGRNVRMDVRWAAASVDRLRNFAKELVELKPGVILVVGTPGTASFQQETRTIPIVFVNVGDPVGDRFVAGLPRPDGNITGFMSQEAEMAGKWLELLTEIAPDITRVVAMFNPDTAPSGGSLFLPSFETAARSLRLDPIPAPVQSDAEIETAVTSLGSKWGGGLVVMPDSFMLVHRAPIILLTARHKVPAVYSRSVFAREGGLLSYGPDIADMFRRAATYVDRILRGAKPAELPVQLPTKFEMVVNVKTATALGLTTPNTLLVSANEVIE
jgi:putative ABC transport system substrate-binding protein